MKRALGHISLVAVGALVGVIAVVAAISAVVITHAGGSHGASAAQQKLSATVKGPAPNQSGTSAGTSDQQGQGRAYLGVQIQEANGKVTISQVVSGGPADKAGLKPGDLITAVNGSAVKNVNDLQTALQNTKPGDNAAVQYQRAGSTQTATVTLGSGSSNSFPIAVPGQPGNGPALPPLGRGGLGGNFDRFISSETRTKDANGAVHTDTTEAGVVKSVGNNQVVVTLNGGGDKTYSADNNTRIRKGFGRQAQLSDLAQGDKVFVTTRDGSSTATSILVVNANGGNVRNIFANGNGGVQITPGNGGLQIQIPGGQNISIPLPDFGNGGSNGSSSGPLY